MNKKNMTLVNLICEGEVCSEDCHSMLRKEIEISGELIRIGTVKINQRRYTQEYVILEILSDINTIGLVCSQFNIQDYNNKGIELIERNQKGYDLIRKRVNAFPNKTNKYYFS